MIAQCQNRVFEGIFFSKEFQYSVLSFKLKAREMFKVLNFLEEKKKCPSTKIKIKIEKDTGKKKEWKKENYRIATKRKIYISYKHKLWELKDF